MTGHQAAPQEDDPLFSAVEGMYDANLAAQRVLREAQGRIEQYMTLLRTGHRAVDIAREHPPAKERDETNEAIEHLTRARQRARAETFRRLIDEGMSRKEIANGWGFSVQVVSRIVNS